MALHKIPFDTEELSFQIQSHPSFPSLHAVTGVLDHFKINNLSLEVPKTQEVFFQLPDIFLAQITSEQGKEFVVVEKNNDKVRCFYSEKKNVKISIVDFLEQFTGIIVAIEKTDEHEKQAIKSTKVNTILAACLGALVLGSIFFGSFNLITIGYLLLSIIGVIVSSAIVKQELGIENTIGAAFCSTTAVKSDCNKVISSKGATILGIFKLSHISAIYFISLSIVSFILILQGFTFSYVYMTSVLALPSIIYSIYYQYVHVKTWCPLCLVIVGVLGVQGIISGFNFSEIITNVKELNTVAILSGVLIGVTLMWNYMFPQIKSNISLKNTKIEFFKFKRNFSLFKTVLEKSPFIETDVNIASELIFGNKKAPLSIVLITSPFCGHCIPVHHQIEDILRAYKDVVAIAVRFNVNTANKETDLYKVTARITELYHTQGADICLQAMGNIYNGMAVEKWITTWGAVKNVSLFDNILNSQNDWCKQNSINFTPEILVNGRSFPKEYDRKDLGLFIEDLAEDCSQELLIPATI